MISRDELTFECVVAFVHQLIIGADVEDADEHLRHFLADERQGPRKHVHEIGQPIWMGAGTGGNDDLSYGVYRKQEPRGS